MFHVQLFGHHLELTDAMKEKIQSKIDEMQAKYPYITSIQISINKVRPHMIEVDCVGKTDHKMMHTIATHSDGYTAIELSLDKFGKQMKKYHDRHQGFENQTIRDMFAVELERESMSLPIQHIYGVHPEYMAIEDACFEVEQFVDHVFLFLDIKDTTKTIPSFVFKPKGERYYYGRIESPDQFLFQEFYFDKATGNIQLIEEKNLHIEHESLGQAIHSLENKDKVFEVFMDTDGSMKLLLKKHTDQPEYHLYYWDSI